MHEQDHPPPLAPHHEPLVTGAGHRRLARLRSEARAPNWWYEPHGQAEAREFVGQDRLLEVSGVPERTVTGRNRVCVVLVDEPFRGWWGWAYVDEIEELAPLEALAVVEDLAGKSEEPSRSTGTSGASR